MTAGVLGMIAACTVPVSTPLFVAAGVAVAVAVVAFGAWLLFCRNLPGFCHSLKTFLDGLSYIIYIQTLVLIVLGLFAWAGSVTPACFLGAVTTFAYYSAIHYYLTVLYAQADCGGYAPPHF